MPISGRMGASFSPWQSHMNDYNGLYSLYFEKAHIAATSLDVDDIRHLVPGIPLVLLSLYKYSVGFYVQAGNPEKISSVEDLTNPKVVFMNREKGSARRVYLDRLLKERGISSEKFQKRLEKDPWQQDVNDLPGLWRNPEPDP